MEKGRGTVKQPGEISYKKKEKMTRRERSKSSVTAGEKCIIINGVNT